jgi:energy-coupling factor transporter ATP-binding protein EcfA2
MLKVIIAGPTKSGKSALAYAIKGLLARAGIEVSYTDPDGQTADEVPGVRAVHGPVGIETVQTMREPGPGHEQVTPEVHALRMKVHELETSIGMILQRRVHKMMDLTGESVGYGNDHPKYKYEDWVDAVREGETRESYWEWVCDEYMKDGGKL